MIYESRIIKGKGRGKTLGFPTLNLVIPKKFPFSTGVYAGWVWLGPARAEKKHPGAFHYGPIPVFKDKTHSLEVFLIGRKLRTAPRNIRFELARKIRPIRNFKTGAELQIQIENDVVVIRNILDKNIG